MALSSSLKLTSREAAAISSYVGVRLGATLEETEHSPASPHSSGKFRTTGRWPQLHPEVNERRNASSEELLLTLGGLEHACVAQELAGRASTIGAGRGGRKATLGTNLPGRGRTHGGTEVGRPAACAARRGGGDGWAGRGEAGHCVVEKELRTASRRRVGAG